MRADRSSLPVPPTVPTSATSAASTFLSLIASVPIATLRHVLARSSVLAVGLVRILVSGHLPCDSLTLNHHLTGELTLSAGLGYALLPFLNCLSDDEASQGSNEE